MFPKVPDYHKSNNPLVPNGLGIFYVLISALYLFALHYLDITKEASEASLSLAVCILFGGFLGLVDDWMDVKWRYKAFLPLFAALPLVTLPWVDTWMATYIFGKINFGIYFYAVIVPLIVTVTTNTVNQLGGLNGLETICPLIVMLGLILASAQQSVLLYVPAIVCLVLAYFNFRGKIFIGNTGSFALGITLAAYAIIADIEQTLVISILPYIFNSSLILLTFFLFRARASLVLEKNKLHADHVRSLVTLIAHKRLMTEHQIVEIISLLVALSTATAVLVWFIW